MTAFDSNIAPRHSVNSWYHLIRARSRLEGRFATSKCIYETPILYPEFEGGHKPEKFQVVGR